MDKMRPNIELDNDLPGIQGALAFSPLTGRHISRLVNTLLRSEGGLPFGEREFAMAAALIAVGDKGGFCYRIHSLCASYLLPNGERAISALESRRPREALSNGRLAAIAGLANRVSNFDVIGVRDHVEECRSHGLSEKDVHDVVLIASTAIMLSSYVKAVGAPYPDNDVFEKLARHFIKVGYLSEADRTRA